MPQATRSPFSPQALRFETLVDHGYTPPEHPVGTKLGFFNANPFSTGIANLGYQCVADYLIQRGVNVYFAFADTMNGRAFLNLDIPPCEVDLIAISVPFEDTYLNVLRMLKGAGLPIYARERGSDFPPVIIGGMAMINPLPLQEFGDVFVIGEGRETLYEIVRRFDLCRKHYDKQEFLQAIADLPGVYIPSHFHIRLDADGYVDEFRAIYGSETIVANPPLPLDAYPIHSIWTSRYSCYEYDDYFSLMIAMGCNMKCPYCVVGNTQTDKSGRALISNADQCVEIALNRRERYGTNLIKLFFSSAFHGSLQSNAQELKSLLEILLAHGFQARVGSLNIEQGDDELFRLLKAHGQTKVTFAPESVESLRPSINKEYITDKKLHNLAKLASKHDMDMTLYTLGGLPGENTTHSVQLVQLLRSLRRELKPACRLEIHYNSTIMKAQTPFQFCSTVRPETIRRRYQILKEGLSDLANIQIVSIIDDPMCYFQPILALGDSQVGQVLAHLYTKADVTEADWRSAFPELGLSDQHYFRPKDPDRRLPWEHIVYSNHSLLKRRLVSLARKSGPSPS